MKIEMAWLFMFRLRRFKAPAYCLLPLWLVAEVFYGSLLGSNSGVAHWAHVGGFVFGAVAALGLQHSGVEHKANKAIEEKLAWTADAEIEKANEMMEHGQLADAQALLTSYVAKNPNSLDAWSLLRQVYTRQTDTKSFIEATVKTCALRLRAHQIEAAFQDYAEFIDSGGGKLPAATWLELCKGAEEMQEFDRAFSEYGELARMYPTERQSLTAQLSAARLCLKKLNRPKDALAIYQAAAASPVPHLDWEQIIQSGIKEAKTALAGGSAVAAGAQ
jgi:tetratricopeptide (TPR) repeat protein